MARGFVGRYMQLLVLRKVTDDGRFVHRRLLEVYANGFTSAGGRRISQRVVRAAYYDTTWEEGVLCVFCVCITRVTVFFRFSETSAQPLYILTLVSKL